jgi:proteasome lid subunit RPN8/RPN11
MTLTDSLRAAILRHALQCYPEESCGLIVEGVYLPRPNCSATPTEAFNISPVDWAEAEDLGDIAAVVHSHPDGRPFPSGADFDAQAATGLPWVIVAVSRECSGGFYVFGA